MFYELLSMDSTASVEDYAKAVSAKDIDRVMSLYAPNIVSFYVNLAMRYAGTDNKRRAWQEFFATYTGPVAYEVRDLNVTTDGELAFVHSLNHVKGTLARPVGALDSVLPANRWNLAGCARSRFSPSRPQAWLGCSPNSRFPNSMISIDRPQSRQVRN